MDDLSAEFEKVRAAWREAQWPGVEEGTSFGTPSLKVRKKLICRMRETGVLVLICDMDEKEFLMAAMPEIYYQIPHYYGYGAVLIRLPNISHEELCERLERTWRSLATQKQIEEYEARRS